MKRAHIPFRVRFKRPYAFTMEAPDLAGQVLTIKQAPFSHEGFASTGESICIRLALNPHVALLSESDGNHTQILGEMYPVLQSILPLTRS